MSSYELIRLDFIVTAKSKRILQEQVAPAIESFLSERGLSLSPEKTVITHIKDGFTFLGQRFRKHGNTLHITPTEEGVLALIRKLGTIIREHTSSPMEAMIRRLNQTLRGWANYHKYVVASEAFSRVDTYVFEELWRMLHRRHSNKSTKWLIGQYWSAAGQKSVFSVIRKTPKKRYILKVMRISTIGIKRHIKIQAKANPYLPEYAAYFWRRRHVKDSRLMPS